VNRDVVSVNRKLLTAMGVEGTRWVALYCHCERSPEGAERSKLVLASCEIASSLALRAALLAMIGGLEEHAPFPIPWFTDNRISISLTD